MRRVLAVGLVAVIAGILSCDSAECEENADCTEVVCPDLSKHTICKDDGSCLKLEDCETPSGW